MFRHLRLTLKFLKSQLVRITAEGNRNKNKFLIINTIDVKNVLNTAPLGLVIKALKKQQIEIYLIKLMCSYQENRKIVVGERKKIKHNIRSPT